MNLVNIDSQAEVQNFWSYLGPFYDNITPAQKTTIEKFWKALADGVESLAINSLEAYYSSNLNFTKGYIEDRFINLKIDTRNCLAIPHAPPVLEILQNGTLLDTYREVFITGVQIIDGEEVQTTASDTVIVSTTEAFGITWEFLPNITKYYIYTKTTDNGVVVYEIENKNLIEDFSALTEVTGVEPPIKNLTVLKYVYNLGNEDYFITIPTLVAKYSELTLTEGTDYTIVNLNELHLNFGIDVYDEYYADAIIKVAPILKSMYLQIFGEELYYKEIFKQSFYSAYVVADTAIETKLNNLAHLAKLVHAVVLSLLKGCSLKRLEYVINLFHNVPFAYETGVVQSIDSSDTLYNVIDISGILYKIPKTLVFAYEVEDTVDKYSLLCSNIITADDYISDLNLLTANTDEDTLHNTVMLVIPQEINDLNYMKGITNYNLLDHLKTIVLNPGLVFTT